MHRQASNPVSTGGGNGGGRRLYSYISGSEDDDDDVRDIVGDRSKHVRPIGDWPDGPIGQPSVRAALRDVPPPAVLDDDDMEGGGTSDVSSPSWVRSESEMDDETEADERRIGKGANDDGRLRGSGPGMSRAAKRPSVGINNSANVYSKLNGRTGTVQE